MTAPASTRNPAAYKGGIRWGIISRKLIEHSHCGEFDIVTRRHPGLDQYCVLRPLGGGSETRRGAGQQAYLGESYHRARYLHRRLFVHSRVARRGNFLLSELRRAEGTTHVQGG